MTLSLLANRVSTRRALDRNTLGQLHDELDGVVTEGVLYDRAVAQYAKDRPVWRVQSDESQILAAREVKAVCNQIFDKAVVQKDKDVTAAVTNRKPGLNPGKLSAVAQVAVKPVRPADAKIKPTRIYGVKQVHKTFRSLEEPVKSFKLNGIIEPLVVHKETDGHYRVIVGERRYRAAPLAGLVKAPVIIKKGLTELQIHRLQTTENSDRDDLTACEEAIGVIGGAELYGTKEVMTIWNRGEIWVNKRMAVHHYADPVREPLGNDLCDDFEVFHYLNRIYDIEDTYTEFSRLSRRMNEGLPLSRDEAHNTLARAKAWGQQQDDLAQRRIELDNAKKANDKAPERTPTWLEEQRKRGAERAAAGADAGDQNGDGDQDPAPVPAVASGRGQQALPTTKLTPEQRAAAEKERANERPLSLREETFEQGEANQAQFFSMKTHMTTLDHSMHEIE